MLIYLRHIDSMGDFLQSELGIGAPEKPQRSQRSPSLVLAAILWVLAVVVYSTPTTSVAIAGVPWPALALSGVASVFSMVAIFRR